MGISVGGKNLEDSGINGKKGDIEGSSAQIKYEYVGLSSSLVHTVGNGGSSRLVDNTLNLHSRNGSGILGGLTLGIIEIGRYGNNGVSNIFSKEDLGGTLHLLKNHGGNLLGGELLGGSSNSNLDNGLVGVRDNLIRYELLIGLYGFVRVITSDKTLNVENGVFGVDGGLILGSISYQTVTVVHEGDVRRCDTITLVVGNDFDTSILEDSDARVGGSQINSNDGSHLLLLGVSGGGHKGQCGKSDILEKHCF
mmetsp:Transcript_3538/g.3327  ORF Transcript_3538/g.3327 Transcript_3538/m.3327 type:complete len:252 (-) Transcript_3538:2-757(-)